MDQLTSEEASKPIWLGRGDSDLQHPVRYVGRDARGAPLRVDLLDNAHPRRDMAEQRVRSRERFAFGTGDYEPLASTGMRLASVRHRDRSEWVLVGRVRCRCGILVGNGVSRATGPGSRWVSGLIHE